MSRRNQSRRRRSYGRRQHEVRERRPGNPLDPDWMPDAPLDAGWTPADPAGGTAQTHGDALGGYAR